MSRLAFFFFSYTTNSFVFSYRCMYVGAFSSRYLFLRWFVLFCSRSARADCTSGLRSSRSGPATAARSSSAGGSRSSWTSESRPRRRGCWRWDIFSCTRSGEGWGLGLNGAGKRVGLLILWRDSLSLVYSPFCSMPVEPDVVLVNAAATIRQQRVPLLPSLPCVFLLQYFFFIYAVDQSVGN